MRRYVLIGFVWCLLCTQALAVTISPLVMELNTDHQLTSQLVVTNNSTETLALEANVHQLQFLEDGVIKTSNKPDEDVLVFPPAVLLKPGKHQTFRVQWVSNAPLKTSKSHFVRFSTANIVRDSEEFTRLTDFSTGINIQIHYNALLHVFSSSLQPDIKMDISQQGDLTLTNSGNRFTFTTALHFKNLDDTYSHALQEALGEQFLPPHSTMTFNSSRKNLPTGTYYGYEN